MPSFNMASTYERRSILPKVLESLFNQTVDCSINVYLNYPHEAIEHPRVNFFPFQGDFGDTSKFFRISQGWNLFVDDDIIYPRDYAEKMLKISSDLGCPAGVHGAIIKRNPKDYFKDRKVIHFTSPHEGSFVNCLGTGTLCFHSDIGFSRKFIDSPNMSDCFFAAWCQEREIPLYCVDRGYTWLIPISTNESLWKNRGKGKKQTEVIKRIENWKVFKKKTT